MLRVRFQANYAALHVLDVEIQNKGESYAVINDVLAAQYELIKEMRNE